MSDGGTYASPHRYGADSMRCSHHGRFDLMERLPFCPLCSDDLVERVERAEARVEELEAVLTALAPFVRWIEEHYPRAIREMPSHVFQGVDTARDALGGGS